MINTTFNDSDIDALVFSGHKIYAPGSPGAVIAKSSLFENTSPCELGGGMVTDVYLEKYMMSEVLPDREEAAAT